MTTPAYGYSSKRDFMFRCDHYVNGAPRNCSLPVAIYEDGALTLTVRHHGERHHVRIPIDKLIEHLPAAELTKVLTKFNEVVETVP